MAGVILVDASVLIAHLDTTDVHHARAKAMLLEAVEHQLAASSITLAEIMVGPAQAGKLEAVRTALRDLEIEEVPVPKGAAERLARIRSETRLKLPDCCVLLAAEHINADTVMTFDDRLAKRARDLGYMLWAGSSESGEGGHAEPKA